MGNTAETLYHPITGEELATVPVANAATAPTTGDPTAETAAASAIDMDKLNSFMEGMGLTEAQQDRFDAATTYLGVAGTKISNFFNSLTGAEVTPVENAKDVVRDLIAEKGPDNFLNGLAAVHPDAAGAIELIRADKDLSVALHNAAVKDPTVLEGLSTLVGEGSAMKPEQLETALKDPQNRANLTQMLDGVAKSEHLQFTDLAKVLNAGVALQGDMTNPEKLKTYKESLQAFGINDSRADMAEMMGDPMKMLSDFINNPDKYTKMLVESMGIQDAETRNLVAGLAGGLGRVMAGVIDPEGDMFGHYIQGGKDIWNNASPKIKVAGAEIMDGGGTLTGMFTKLADPTTADNEPTAPTTKVAAAPVVAAPGMAA